MPSPSPFTLLWKRGLITWLTYTVAGLLAVSLAAPGEIVSPLYLPAGLGLALVLGWGPWMLLATGLGSATVVTLNLHFSQPSAGLQAMLWAPLLSGLGASLQAWGACRLTRQTPGQDIVLDTPAQIVRFLLLAGPLACVINAAVSVSGLVALGILPWTAAAQAFAGWWAGDTMGVLLGAPMMLTLVGQPGEPWRARREQVGLPLLVAAVLLTLAVRQVQMWRVERETAAFDHDVVITSNEVQLRLSGYLDALAALSGVFDASDQVTRSEFAQASHYWLDALKGIQAIGWDERVYRKDLPEFERRQQADGVPAYKVYAAPAMAEPAGQEVVAVRYVEPRTGNDKALGFDVLSSGASRQAYERARREGLVAATRGFRLIQEPAQQAGVVIYRPVFKGQPYTPQARVQANMGAVFMALRMDDALATMLQDKPAYMDACLLDASETNSPVLGGSPLCKAGLAKPMGHYQASVPLSFAGRHWQLLLWNTGSVPVLGQKATSWLLAVAGVTFAAALGALLLVMTGHARRLEAAMAEASRQRREAEAANQAKSAFLSRMSHELRTPLNAVLGFAQVMALEQRDPLPPSQRQRVEQIQQAGWHLLDMIDDVLDISRIDAGTLRLNSEPLRIRDELAHAFKALQDDANKQGVQLSLVDDIPADWGVTADATRLRQILSNLLSNAIKFNHRGGSVKVKVSQAQDSKGAPVMLVAVQDTGMGMSAEQLSQLFQPFNRLGREQGQTSGTGIGLVISQHLASLMGGQLDVQSAEGQGATFTLSLPALTLPPRQQAAVRRGMTTTMPALAEGQMPRPRHVLYVEDNLANSEVIRAALGARPWITVTVAPTTEEGLAVLHDRLRGSKPDLILLDVHLPDASGQELLKLIKANPDTVDIPVIMISADAMPEQIDAALSAGACCYLTKPVQLPELLREVDELLPN